MYYRPFNGVFYATISLNSLSITLSISETQYRIYYP